MNRRKRREPSQTDKQKEAKVAKGRRKLFFACLAAFCSLFSVPFVISCSILFASFRTGPCPGRAASDRLAHRHRAGGGEETLLVKLGLHGAEVVETVGIDPNRDRRALRAMVGQATAELRAGAEGLRRRLTEVRLNIDEVNPLQLDRAVAGRAAAQLDIDFGLPQDVFGPKARDLADREPRREHCRAAC